MSFVNGTVMSSVPDAAALTAMPAALENVGIFCCELMSMLTVRLRAFFCGMGGNGERERGGIPLKFFVQRLLKRPPGFQPTVKSPHINTVFFCKLCDMRLDTINDNRAFLARISGLFFPTRPTAIFRTIVAVIVNAFQCHLEWTRTHILKERLKRTAPAVANSNSTASVVMVVGGIGIGASLFHSYVSYVCTLFCLVSHGNPLGNNGEIIMHSFRSGV